MRSIFSPNLMGQRRATYIMVGGQRHFNRKLPKKRFLLVLFFFPWGETFAKSSPISRKYGQVKTFRSSRPTSTAARCSRTIRVQIAREQSRREQLFFSVLSSIFLFLHYCTTTTNIPSSIVVVVVVVIPSAGVRRGWPHRQRRGAEALRHAALQVAAAAQPPHPDAVGEREAAPGGVSGVVRNLFRGAVVSVAAGSVSRREETQRSSLRRNCCI